MIQNQIKSLLRTLTKHRFIEITSRGNEAINAALSLIPQRGMILIPEEGGWIHYEKAPPKLGLKVAKVSCNDARINLDDLSVKLKELKPGAFLYQNPGGYFAEQPLKEIHELCQKHNCLVIMDVSGALGTSLCDGTDVDILVGSFGKGKLVNANIGGFVSSNDENLLSSATLGVGTLNKEDFLSIIYQELQKLPARIKFLTSIKHKIVHDLKNFDIIHRDDVGFVVAVKYSLPEEKQKLISYCQEHQLEYTECPRYMRLLKPAISIEVKRK